jgi:hypothetical protein
MRWEDLAESVIQRTMKALNLHLWGMDSCIRRLGDPNLVFISTEEIGGRQVDLIHT